MTYLLMEANFRSTARALPRRARSMREFEVVYRLPMLLPQAAKEDFLHCADLSGRQVFAWNGKLWSRMLAHFDASRSLSAVDMSLLEMVFDGRATAPEHDFPRAGEDPAWAAYQVIEDDGKAAAELRAAEVSGSVVLCDGIAYREVHVPDLWLRVGYRDVTVCHRMRHTVFSGLLRFTWNEREEALRIARALCGKSGADLRDETEGLFNVLVAEALPPLAPVVPAEELSRLPGRMPQNLNHVDEDDIRRWLQVRIACDRADTVGVCEAMADFTCGLLDRSAPCRDCDRLAAEMALNTEAVVMRFSTTSPPEDRERIRMAVDRFEWKAEAA